MTGIQDPIRPSDFRPVACETLARLGGANDGGYVVPLEAVKAAGALLSFGLSYDWSFERDFKKLNAGAIVHCYDHTVSLSTALEHSIGQLSRFVARRKASRLWNVLTWIDYLLFFRVDRIHFRQRLWRDNQGGSATVDDAFGRLPPGCQVFVKMDVEGSEYRVLDDLLRHSRNIVAIAIEFHDVDILAEKFVLLGEQSKRDIHIVHLHGNTNCGMTPSNFPNAPEITFLSKRFFASPPPPSRLNYPVPGLDSPNKVGVPDLALEL